MARTLVSTIVSEVTGSSLRPVLMVVMEFDLATTRIWNGVGDLVVGADTFVGVGGLISVGPIEETANVRAAGINLNVTGVDSDKISIALSEEYQGRIATVWLGFMDSSNDYIDRVQVFKGRLDVMNIEESGPIANISVSVENILISLERIRERRFTDEDQKSQFAGDRGFEFVTSLQQQDIPWGRS